MASRIVGGKVAGVNEYPWQIGLIVPGTKSPFCGGTIISHQHILTAAHCTYGKNPPDINVLLGEHDTTDSQAEYLPIVKIKIHPGYDDITMHYDFAILTLIRNIRYSLVMSPVCLPFDVTNKYTEKVAKVTGWGTTSSGGDVSNTLREVEMKVIDNYVCSWNYSGEIKRYHQSPLLIYTWAFCALCNLRDQICAYEPGNDACQGDSGGPMFLFENSR